MNKTDTAATQRTDEQKGQLAKQPTKPEQQTTPLARRDEYGLRRLDPFAIFEDLQQEMARVWQQMMPWSPRQYVQPARGEGQMPTPWMPAMDVYEKDNQLVVKAELPGVKKEDIDVEVDQGYLVIRGHRQTEHEDRKGSYYRSERSFGSFYRRLPLPEGIKADQITATYKDGILEVRMPKPAQSQPDRQKIALT